MKLYEEFKLVEDLWDDEDIFVDMYNPAESTATRLADLPPEVQQLIQKQTNKPLRAVLKTFGSKTYNLVELQDMEAWVKANADFQFKRHPNSYTHFATDKDDFTPTESHAKYIYITILKNLEKSLDFASMDSRSRRSVEKNLLTLRNKYYNAWMDRYDNASGRKQAVELYDKEFDEFIDKVLPGAAAGYKKQFKSALKDLWAEYNKRTARGYAL